MKRKRLVLLGAGHAHLQVLQAFQKEFPLDLDICLVSPYEKVLYSGMLPGWIAGHYSLEELSISLPAFLAKSLAQNPPRITWLQSQAVCLDTQAKQVLLSNGQALAYDWLSINTGSEMDKKHIDTQIPGAREHALFIRPLELFAALWPRFLEHASKQGLNISVIGAGAGGVELALALQHRLTHCRVSLIAGEHEPLQGYARSVQKRVKLALINSKITVLQARCVGIESGKIHLNTGASLSCDAPIVATGGHAPRWLQGNGLQLDDAGYALVNAYQQSVSHPEIFAAGDVASRQDAPHPKSGVYAVRSGLPLANNLLAAAQGSALKKYAIRSRSLNLISLGLRTCVLSWGAIGFQADWLWHWKDSIDRRWMARFQKELP